MFQILTMLNKGSQMDLNKNPSGGVSAKYDKCDKCHKCHKRFCY